MQITLVQTEIEQAIREYVGRQMTVKNGATMSIELAATRGAEGFKATIDIQPGPQVLTSPTYRGTDGPQAHPIANHAVRSASPALIEAAQEAEALNEPVSVQETSDENPTSGVLEQNEGTEGEAQPASPARSLFKGLSKPKNS